MCLACKPIPKSMINDWVQDLKVKLCNIGVFLQDITISSSFLFRRTTRYCATKVIETLAMNNDKGENYTTFNIQCLKIRGLEMFNQNPMLFKLSNLKIIFVILDVLQIPMLTDLFLKEKFSVNLFSKFQMYIDCG